MSRKMEKALEQTAPSEECRHYWVIEPARGPVSRGICKRCGAEKEFQNIFSASWYDEEDLPSFMQPDSTISVEDDLDKP